MCTVKVCIGLRDNMHQTDPSTTTLVKKNSNSHPFQVPSTLTQHIHKISAQMDLPWDLFKSSLKGKPHSWSHKKLFDYVKTTTETNLNRTQLKTLKLCLQTEYELIGANIHRVLMFMCVLLYRKSVFIVIFLECLYWWVLIHLSYGSFCMVPANCFS